MAEVFAAYGPDDQVGIVVYEKRTPSPTVASVAAHREATTGSPVGSMRS